MAERYTHLTAIVIKFSAAHVERIAMHLQWSIMYSYPQKRLR